MTNTVCAPRLGSFQEAKTWYERTPPIRGHKDKVRPLGQRRYHSRASIAMPDDNHVVLEYIKSPVVTWSADDMFVVQAPVYYSSYAVDDLCGYLPSGMKFTWRGCRLFITYLDGGGHRSYLIERGESYVFSRIDKGLFQLQDKPKAFRFVRRRGALDKLMTERYGAFLDWASVVNAVNNIYTEEDALKSHDLLRVEAGVPLSDTYSMLLKTNQRIYDDYDLWENVRNAEQLPFRRRYDKPTSFHTPSCAVLDKWMTGTPEEWVQALHVIAKRAGRYRHVAGNVSSWIVSMDQIALFVSHIAGHLFFDKLFETQELEDGAVPPRTHAAYKKTITFRDISNIIRNVPSVQ